MMFRKIKNANKILNFMFLIIVFVILIFPITRINKNKVSSLENRTLAGSATLIVDGRINTKFGNDFETWLSDRFRCREKVINCYTEVDSWLQGRIENSKAFLGGEGWLFYKAENSISNFQNKNLFTEAELSKIKSNILKRQALLEQHGIKYYVFIAPDKNRVYGEHYYPEIKKIREKGRAEELMLYLNKADTNIIFPLAEIIESKKQGNVYYKLDTHWNNYGAFIGYGKLMELIKNDYPSLKCMKLKDFNIAHVEEKHGDLLNMLNVPIEKLEIKDNKVLRLDKKSPYNYKYLKNNGREGVSTENPNPLNQLRVFVLRDSFTTAMEPFVSETFKCSEYVWTHNFNEQYDEILKYKPDIVVQEIVERYAHTLLIDSPSIKEEIR